jgi:ubiquinone/menaquinone biosynthesis C-methylase UbiE
MSDVTNNSRSEKPPGAGSSSIDLIDIDLFFKALALKPGISVVDLGSGPGDYSIPIATVIGSEGRVYAVDLWQGCVEFLQSEIVRLGIVNIEPILADMSKRLPFEGDSIDACLMATILHDLKDNQSHDAALTEVKRILKKGGIFAVVEFTKRDGPPGPPASIRLSPEETTMLVEPHGFTRKGLYDLGPCTSLVIYSNTYRVTPRPPADRMIQDENPGSENILDNKL